MTENPKDPHPAGQPPRPEIVGRENVVPHEGNYPVPSPENYRRTALPPVELVGTPRASTSTEWEDHEGAIHRNHRKQVVTGWVEGSGQPQGVGVRAHSTKGPQPESPVSKSPTRKVVSQGLGGALGGHVAVLVAYHYPELPPTVVGAYTALFVVVVGFLVGYFVRAED